MLREVLRFVEALVERLGGGKIMMEPNQAEIAKRSLGEVIWLMRSQVEAEDCSLGEEDVFVDVRDRMPAPLDPRW